MVDEPELFLVVVPTIRQSRTGFRDVMDRIQKTFLFPTKFLILDGSDGKPVALNKALQEILPTSTAQYYVTLDDDYIPGSDWQAKSIQAFQDLPKLGMLAFWVGDDPELQKLIGAERCESRAKVGKTGFRRTMRGHHLAGAIHVYRREVALALGPQPITAQKYQVWEDAWRGRRVQHLGWELAYIDSELPEFIEYDDPVEYIQWRESQVTESRQDQDLHLKDSGIPDPWHLKLRRWIARLRKRV